MEASALDSDESIALAEGVNVDIDDAVEAEVASDEETAISDAVEAEVALEAEADTPDDAADAAIIEDAALESAEDLIPLAEDDDVDVHNLVEVEEEGNIAFGGATIAATAVGLTAAGTVVIGARAAAEDDVDAEVPEVAREVEDNIVEASIDSAEYSMTLVEDDNVDDVIETEVALKAEAAAPEDVEEADITTGTYQQRIHQP